MKSRDDESCEGGVQGSASLLMRASDSRSLAPSQSRPADSLTATEVSVVKPATSPLAQRFGELLEEGDAPGADVLALSGSRAGTDNGALAAALAGPEESGRNLRSKLRKAAETFPVAPALFKRRRPGAQPAGTGSALDLILASLQDDAAAAKICVPGWPNDPTYQGYIASKGLSPATVAAAVASGGRVAGKSEKVIGRQGGGTGANHYTVPRTRTTPVAPRNGAPVAALTVADDGSAELRQSVHKAAGKKGIAGARTYTSRYRGVHQTFPTRRWEAQFRRAGKPTSLGCFDREEEAARAYDKMMLWCEIHHADLRTLGLLRNGVTNFPPGDYAPDMTALREMSQDDLVAELRRMGRLQSAGAGPAYRGSGAAAPRTVTGPEDDV